MWRKHRICRQGIIISTHLLHRQVTKNLCPFQSPQPSSRGDASSKETWGLKKHKIKEGTSHTARHVSNWIFDLNLNKNIYIVKPHLLPPARRLSSVLGMSELRCCGEESPGWGVSNIPLLTLTFASLAFTFFWKVRELAKTNSRIDPASHFPLHVAFARFFFLLITFCFLFSPSRSFCILEHKSKSIKEP